MELLETRRFLTWRVCLASGTFGKFYDVCNITISPFFGCVDSFGLLDKVFLDLRSPFFVLLDLSVLPTHQHHAKTGGKLRRMWW